MTDADLLRVAKQGAFWSYVAAVAFQVSFPNPSSASLGLADYTQVDMPGLPTSNQK